MDNKEKNNYKDILKGKVLFIDFDSTFIKVETLDELAKISLQFDPEKESKINQIMSITNRAMSGEVTFPEALQLRIDLLKLNKNNIEKVKEHIKTLISDSFIKSRELISSLSNDIWIISGGFKEVICPIVSEFGINENRVIANNFIYNNQNIVGCNHRSILFQNKGKVKAIESLNIESMAVMIGDGFTDLEVLLEGACDMFICYTENITRDNVANQSEFIAKNFDEILEILSN